MNINNSIISFPTDSVYPVFQIYHFHTVAGSGDAAMEFPYTCIHRYITQIHFKGGNIIYSIIHMKMIHRCTFPSPGDIGPISELLKFFDDVKCWMSTNFLQLPPGEIII